MKSESLMGYLGDYLRWRGDLTFDQAPFCDADSLALTMLSYLNPEEVTAPGQKIAGVRLSEAGTALCPFLHNGKKAGKIVDDGQSSGTFEADGGVEAIRTRHTGGL